VPLAQQTICHGRCHQAGVDLRIRIRATRSAKPALGVLRGVPDFGGHELVWHQLSVYPRSSGATNLLPWGSLNIRPPPLALLQRSALEPAPKTLGSGLDFRTHRCTVVGRRGFRDARRAIRDGSCASRSALSGPSHSRPTGDSSRRSLLSGHASGPLL
jgi:hypothetical protein